MTNKHFGSNLWGKLLTQGHGEWTLEPIRTVGAIKSYQHFVFGLNWIIYWLLYYINSQRSYIVKYSSMSWFCPAMSWFCPAMWWFCPAMSWLCPAMSWLRFLDARHHVRKQYPHQSIAKTTVACRHNTVWDKKNPPHDTERKKSCPLM